MFIRFHRMYERDGRTDGQTPHDSIGSACIASRGKKLLDPIRGQEWCLRPIYLRPRVTLTFDPVTSKVDRFMPLPSGRTMLSCIKNIDVQNIVCTSLVMDGTDRQTNR